MRKNLSCRHNTFDIETHFGRQTQEMFPLNVIDICYHVSRNRINKFQKKKSMVHLYY